MRRSLAVILSTATLGTMVAATGCAEHRYQTSTPYYNSPYYGSNGWDAAEQARYREWLAERRYGYLEYNRLSAERQREYWAWRNSRYGQSVQDRYRNYNRQRVENNARDRDRDRDARRRDQNPYVRNRDDQRSGRDRDDRRSVRDRDGRNRVSQNHSNDKDHDRKATDRDRDRDHDHDHR